MRPSRVVVTKALITGGLVVLASPTWADHTSVHATASGEVATTDNLFATGSNGNRQADVFLTLRPGLLYAYDEPRMIHDFSGEAELTEHLLHSRRPSVTGRGSWRSLFLIGPRAQLTMSINAGTGNLSSLSSRSITDETIATITPTGDVDIHSADASQSLSWVAGKHVRIVQGIHGRYGSTDDGNGTESETRDVGGHLGLERSFRSTSITLDASVSYLRLQSLVPPTSPIGNQYSEQLNPRGLLSARHDFTKRWSANAEGGAVYVNPVGTRNSGNVRRTGDTFGLFGAQVGYTEPRGRAALILRRTVAPNQYLAQNTLEDQATMQVSMPLPWVNDSSRRVKLAGLASLGVARNQAINAETGSLEGEITAARLDTAVAWAPKPGVTWGARYELVYQSGGTNFMMPTDGYYRNTLMFTYSMRYPERVAAELPKRTRSVRSDRKDLVPLGYEPVIPDILDQGQGDDGR
jgi:hypothetical protein